MTQRVTFAELNRAHDDLAELLWLHQECLVAGAFGPARDLLQAYRRLIELHIAHEEEDVLPLYARAETQRWPAEMFTGQHKKLLALLDRIEPMLASLRRVDGWRRGVITALETETTLKHLLEHHHLAEDQALYPIAEEHASDEELAQIVGERVREWGEAVEGARQIMAAGREALRDGSGQAD